MPFDEDGRCLCPDCLSDRLGQLDSDQDLYGRGPSGTREKAPSYGLTFTPLRNILRIPGMLWSAEVELVGIGYSRAARELGCETDSYGGSDGGHGTILATPDATVDAEVKLSRMLDGSPDCAETCCDAYYTLRDAGGVADLSCGHHVHIDASRLAEAGLDVATEVVAAAAALGASCDRTLTALAASGYSEHREDSGNSYGGDWHVGAYAMGDRYKLHGSRTSYAINYGNPHNATVEYRLPNGTLYAERAHAHVGIAAGLVHLASAAILDADPSAVEAVTAAYDRLQGWQSPYCNAVSTPTPPAFSEADGAAFLSRHLHLHTDTLRALHLAAKDGPATRQHEDVWSIAAASRKD